MYILFRKFGHGAVSVRLWNGASFLQAFLKALIGLFACTKTFGGLIMLFSLISVLTLLHWF